MATTLDPRARQTPRLLLRPFRRRDAGAVHEAVKPSLADLAQWLPWAHDNYSRGVSQAFVRDSISSWGDGKAFDFAIRFPQDPDRHIGNVSVWHTSRQNHVGEIGYWVRTDEHSQGICTEAVAAVLEVAFNELHMHKAVLRIAVGNRPSERVAEKLGFFMEGTLREEVRVGDTWMDHTLWSLLRSEWIVERSRYRDEGLLAAGR
jgi:ribosomal-protein-serine acetyltransferase